MPGAELDRDAPRLDVAGEPVSKRLTELDLDHLAGLDCRLHRRRRSGDDADHTPGGGKPDSAREPAAAYRYDDRLRIRQLERERARSRDHVAVVVGRDVVAVEREGMSLGSVVVCAVLDERRRKAA